MKEEREDSGEDEMKDSRWETFPLHIFKNFNVSSAYCCYASRFFCFSKIISYS